MKRFDTEKSCISCGQPIARTNCPDCPQIDVEAFLARETLLRDNMRNHRRLSNAEQDTTLIYDYQTQRDFTVSQFKEQYWRLSDRNVTLDDDVWEENNLVVFLCFEMMNFPTLLRYPRSN